MSTTLKCPREFDVSVAPSWFESWSTARDSPDLVVVLPSHVSIRPAGVVLLAAGIADRRKRGLNTQVDSERYEDSVIWGFFERLELTRRVGRSEAAQVALDDRGQIQQGLWALIDLPSTRRLADNAAEALESQLPSISPSVVRMARFVYEELGANVVQHSRNPETGFGFVAVDPTSKRLQLAFADAGIGFFASLQNNHELAGRIEDDAAALQLALSPRITGTSAPRTNMGIGMKLLVDFSDLLAGDLYIASGSAMLQRKTTVGQRVNTIRAIPPWQGTWICLDAPLP